MNDLIKFHCEECDCVFFLEDDSVVPFYCPLCGGNYLEDTEDGEEDD